MEPKRKRRRAKRRKAMVDPIPDTPENVILALLRSPKRRAGEWRHNRRDKPLEDESQRAKKEFAMSNNIDIQSDELDKVDDRYHTIMTGEAALAQSTGMNLLECAAREVDDLRGLNLERPRANPKYSTKSDVARQAAAWIMLHLNQMSTKMQGHHLEYVDARYRELLAPLVDEENGINPGRWDELGVDPVERAAIAVHRALAHSRVHAPSSETERMLSHIAAHEAVAWLMIYLCFGEH